MITRRAANAAPDLTDQQPPVSEIFRLRERTPQVHVPAEVLVSRPDDDDDLYGNMPFTD